MMVGRSRRLGWLALVAAVVLVMGVLVLIWVLGPGGGATQGTGSADDSSATTGSLRATSGDQITNIMDHGAVGDGVTSDQAAWDAAVAASSPGGTVLLPPGRSFALPEGVIIREPVRVTGYGATLVKPGGSPSLRTWFAVAADDVTLEGITFNDPLDLVNGNVVNLRAGHTGTSIKSNSFYIGAPVAVRMSEVSDVEVADNLIDGAREGIAVSGDATRVSIRGNEIRGWRNYGIHLFGTAEGSPSDIDITGNRVTDLAPGGSPRYPIHTEQSTSAERLSRVSVVGNVVLGPGTSFTSGQDGTADQISMHAVDGLVVDGNISRGGGEAGLTVESCRDAMVTGNIVNGADVAGIAVFTDVVNVTVTDNTVMNNGQNRAGDRVLASRAGIRLFTSATIGPEDVSIVDNVLGDNQDVKTQQYGVSIRATTDVVAGPNVDAGNVISLYLDDADNTDLSLVQAGSPTGRDQR